MGIELSQEGMNVTYRFDLGCFFIVFGLQRSLLLRDQLLLFSMKLGSFVADMAAATAANVEAAQASRLAAAQAAAGAAGNV